MIISLEIVSLLDVLGRNPKNELEKSEKLETALPHPLSSTYDYVITTIVDKLGESEIFPRRRASTCPTQCPIIEIISN